MKGFLTIFISSKSGILSVMYVISSGTYSQHARKNSLSKKNKKKYIPFALDDSKKERFVQELRSDEAMNNGNGVIGNTEESEDNIVGCIIIEMKTKLQRGANLRRRNTKNLTAASCTMICLVFLECDL